MSRAVQPRFATPIDCLVSRSGPLPHLAEFRSTLQTSLPARIKVPAGRGAWLESSSSRGTPWSRPGSRKGSRTKVAQSPAAVRAASSFLRVLLRAWFRLALDRRTADDALRHPFSRALRTASRWPLVRLFLLTSRIEASLPLFRQGEFANLRKSFPNCVVGGVPLIVLSATSGE